MNNETLKLIYEITQRYVPARDVMTICPLISYSIDSLSSVLLVLTLRESYRLLFGNHAIRITVLSPPEEYETENIYGKSNNFLEVNGRSAINFGDGSRGNINKCKLTEIMFLIRPG